MNNKFVRCEDFMGNSIYWLNGLTLEQSLLTENVCGIFPNPDYSEDNYFKYGEKRYICEITLAPYHEEKIIEQFMLLKDAKAWGVKEFSKHNQ